MKITMIMLAAGNSSRFGSNKLLQLIDGKPMYMHTLEKLIKASEYFEDSRVIVVTQYDEIITETQKLGIDCYVNRCPQRGISSSMQIGLRQAQKSDACLFAVADQPNLSAKTIVSLVQLFMDENKGMACTRCGDRTGNPCIFGHRYFRELMILSGDRGGKALIKKYPGVVSYLDVHNETELRDVDMPSDLL